MPLDNRSNMHLKTLLGGMVSLLWLTMTNALTVPSHDLSKRQEGGNLVFCHFMVRTITNRSWGSKPTKLYRLVSLEAAPALQTTTTTCSVLKLPALMRLPSTLALIPIPMPSFDLPTSLPPTTI
jgi:hypothetical protein